MLQLNYTFTNQKPQGHFQSIKKLKNGKSCSFFCSGPKLQLNCYRSLINNQGIKDFASFGSVQLFYFVTSRPLKASYIKTGVKKKVEAAKQYMLSHAGYLHGYFTICAHIDLDAI